jgi:hypothetical protein
VASAVVLGLVALLQIALAMLMGAAALMVRGGELSRPGAPPVPGWIAGVQWGMCALLVLFAAWSVATTIGVYRLRRWARVSILVIGGWMAFFGGISLLMFAAMMFVPLPGVDNSQAPNVQAVMRVMFALFAVFYAVVTGVGVWWLVYFNRRKVRALFAGEAGELVEPQRPLPISVIAVMCMIGAVSCLGLMLTHWPGMFMGLILRGWEKNAVYLAFAVVAGASGVGLWMLKEWARRLQLAYLAVGAVNMAVMMLSPGVWSRYQAEIHAIMNPGRPQLAMPAQRAMHFAIFGVSLLVTVAFAAVLQHYRGRFAAGDVVAGSVPPAPDEPAA